MVDIAGGQRVPRIAVSFELESLDSANALGQILNNSRREPFPHARSRIFKVYLWAAVHLPCLQVTP